VAGDRAYSCERIRCWLSKRGIEAVIPTRSNQPPEPLNRRKYKRRNVVERCIGWLKWCRRIATRYEKLAESYLSMVKLAMIQRCNRLLELSNRT
jgi:transposase